MIGVSGLLSGEPLDHFTDLQARADLRPAVPYGRSSLCLMGLSRSVPRYFRGDLLERVTGIEPALSAWEADVLPLNYTRVGLRVYLSARRDSSDPKDSKSRIAEE